jgi:hypothetical protein
MNANNYSSIEQREDGKSSLGDGLGHLLRLLEKQGLVELLFLEFL